jgi:two-component system nitrogen regulation sensor histidine kinase NtrY
MLFFNVGIENLFKSPIKNVIDNAERVASIYIDDMKFNMENFVNGLFDQINSCINGVSINKNQMSKILEEETSSLKVDAVVLQIVDGQNINVITSTPFSISLQFEELPAEVSYLNEGAVIAWESDDLVLSITKINNDLGIYLLASIPINSIILDHKHKIKTGIEEYTNLATKRTGIKVTFMTFFSVVTILLLLLSFIIGIVFANWILKPVKKLIIATKNVTSGDYNSPIRVGHFKNEWDVLISTFNDMILKLDQQKRQLIVSQRQNAWRDIARKIAHEIKNPLTPIQLSAERLKSKYQNEIVTQPEVFNSCINTITRQVSCIGKLVKEFSDFARMPPPKFENVDIVHLLREAVFMQSNAYKSISFHQTYDRDSCICEIDQDQINQVLINILQNAVNAISENHSCGAEKIIGSITLDFCVENDLTHIIIEDDGPGFSDTAIEKALDPYYTTRADGTGLGLSIVHKIVTDHSGEIKLGKSKWSGGASIAIVLPRIQEIGGKGYGV